MIYYPIQSFFARGTFPLNWSERYQIFSPLNESFKGALFLAQNKQTLQTVVCRVLYHTTAEYYQTLQHLSSPHVPQIFEVIQDQEDTIIIEEYIHGETLASYLERGGIFSLQDTVSVLLQLCEALEAIHSCGIIHRDIKPANILLNNGRVVLIDFDAARQYQQNRQKDTVYMGTEGYAAPEQYGFSQTDSRSDIYSLGVVLRELCGDAPQHPLAPIIFRCTAFDPANRYGAAREIISDLERAGLIVLKSAPAAQRQSVPAQAPNNPSSAQPKGWKTVLKIVLGTFFALETVILLIRYPHEVTALDYLLSKLVYLQLVIFPAIILFNLLHIWKWLPLLRSSNKLLQVLGVFLYSLLFLVVIVLLNILAYTFYSPEALEILQASTV